MKFAGLRVTVAGLGHFGGGTAAVRWLAAQGARLVVTDLLPADKLADSLHHIADLDVQLHLGGHIREDFTAADLVVASPAIPPHSPFLSAAAAAGVPVTTEIALFTQRCRGRVIGITGTKGKSTTTAMVHHVLASHLGPGAVWLGGNIGASLLADLPRIQPHHWVVLELSSFMLHYLGQDGFAPDIAAITMLGADHLTWHGGREAYLEAKANLIRYQRADQHAVLHRDDAPSVALAARCRAAVSWYGAADADDVTLHLLGRHNRANAAAALAVSACAGVPRSAAAAALANFRGLPHRLELVHEAGGVRWINDSIATIPEAAVAALRCFDPERVIQIVGGSDKQLDMAPLCRALAGVRRVLCIGALGARLAADIGPVAVYVETLARAVAAARAEARPGDVVLLSPGCASYDQFVDFQERGRQFAQLAREEW